MLLPFFWMVSSSLKEDAELFGLPLRWLPSQLDFENYRSMIEITNFGQLFQNTLVVTLADVVGQIVLCSMAGYAFARLKFPGKNFLFVALLITMMMPFEVLVLPIFLFARAFPLAGGNDIFGSVLSNNEGDYIIDGLNPGIYTLKAISESFNIGSKEGISIIEGDIISNINFLLQKQ